MRSLHPGIIIMFMGFAGIVMAFIEHALYTEGVGVTALANVGLTISECMTITVVLWLLFGTVIGVMKS